MNQNRANKEAIVTEVAARIKADENLVIAHNKGLNMEEMTKLRGDLRKNGARAKVFKNTLVLRAIEGTPYAGLAPLLKGPTMIASSKDPVTTAKIMHAFAKGHEKLVILGGSLGAQILDAKAVSALAVLPSLDELRGKIVGLLQAPASKLARIVQAPPAQLARVVNAYAQKG